jgi:hypothetical protein
LEQFIDDYGKTMLATKSCAPEGGASGASRPHARPVAHVQPPASGPRYSLLDCTAAEISIYRSLLRRSDRVAQLIVFRRADQGFPASGQPLGELG